MKFCAEIFWGFSSGCFYVSVEILMLFCLGLPEDMLGPPKGDPNTVICDA